MPGALKTRGYADEGMTQLSGPLLDAIEAGAINRRFIP